MHILDIEIEVSTIEDAEPPQEEIQSLLEFIGDWCDRNSVVSIHMTGTPEDEVDGLLN